MGLEPQPALVSQLHHDDIHTRSPIIIIESCLSSSTLLTMASADFDNFGNAPYLNHNEQNLLLNALKSNKAGDAVPSTDTLNPDLTQLAPDSGFFDPSLLESDFPQDFNWDLDANTIDELRNENGQTSSQNSADADDASPISQDGKRKDHPDDDDDDASTGKRREGEEKVAKKPGRKPLTSEPTSVSFLGNLLKSHSPLTTSRSERHRIGLRRGLSVSAKRSISVILRPRSRISKRLQRPQIMRTASFVLKWTDCRLSLQSTGSELALPHSLPATLPIPAATRSIGTSIQTSTSSSQPSELSPALLARRRSQSNT